MIGLVCPHDRGEGGVLCPPEEKLFGPDDSQLRERRVTANVAVAQTDSGPGNSQRQGGDDRRLDAVRGRPVDRLVTGPTHSQLGLSSS